MRGHALAGIHNSLFFSGCLITAFGHDNDISEAFGTAHRYALSPMSTYAIGDVHGCYSELQDLLKKINFDANKDRLWFTGDLIGRGPHSLETLRFVKRLNAITVLGNHDLHFLASVRREAGINERDSVNDILNAPDRDGLLNWLQNLPLIHHDQESGFTLIHAGLPPEWDLSSAIACGREVESYLRSDRAETFFGNMYGDKPDKWSEELQSWDRLRFVINSFTRLRYCAPDGALTMTESRPPGAQPEPYIPWFQVQHRKSKALKIIFGHWASIHLGHIKDFKPYHVYPLDTGCSAGRELTAMRLEDEELFSVPSRQKKVDLNLDHA